MNRLSKAWPGGKEVLKNVSLSFFPGAKIGVLGLNGSGKSTLLRIMAGIETEFQGEAWAADGIKVGYLPQEPDLDPTLDVAGNVLAGMGRAKELVDRFNEVSAKFAEEMTDEEMNAVIAEQAELQEEIDAIDGWDLERKAEIAMDALRVPAGDADVTKLSGGEKRRVALCQLLLSAPDMLLLDEPTNHLDAESVAWLQKFLHDFPGTVVTITHDRYFLDEVAGWILELDRGAGIPYEGNYSGWLEQKQKRLEQEGRADDARVKSLSRELDWVRAAPKARQVKSKARINAYEKLLARMLKSGANLLLLDEPTNDLDVDTLRALEEALEEFAGCAVVVSHDRWFLDRIATHILAFEGESHVEWFEGNYEAYEADKKRRLGADADRPTRIKYKPLSR